MASEQAKSFAQGLSERGDEAKIFEAEGLRSLAVGGAIEHRI
ncbi:MAG: hypothetical protein ACI9DC_004186 [Gammaproteobacteria bacterium]|jgi:hypothetical protein